MSDLFAVSAKDRRRAEAYTRWSTYNMIEAATPLMLVGIFALFIGGAFALFLATGGSAALAGASVPPVDGWWIPLPAVCGPGALLLALAITCEVVSGRRERAHRLLNPVVEP